MGASTKDKRDVFYRRGKAEGYRARSAYKLIHLDEVFAFLQPRSPQHAYRARFRLPGTLPARPPQPHSHSQASTTPQRSQNENENENENEKRTIVDLCAAPGSWSQVLTRTLTPTQPQDANADADAVTLVAVDLQQMAPLPRVLQLTADITLPSTAARLRTLANDDLAQLIICDGAPDIHGLHILDEFLHAFLLRAALSTTIRLLKPGGIFIAKIFSHDSRPTLSTAAALHLQPSSSSSSSKVKGVKLPYRIRDDSNADPTVSAHHALVPQLEPFFAAVHVLKPASSRPSSAEHFVVCLDFLRARARAAESREEDGIQEVVGKEDGPLASSLWGNVQGRDSIAACLLEGHPLPPADQEEPSAEASRRAALHTLLRFAAEGDLGQ